ncbi:uncharacterized protein LOC144123600 [Amblyomma americanum]
MHGIPPLAPRILMTGVPHHFAGPASSRRDRCTRAVLVASLSMTLLFLLTASLATRTAKLWINSTTEIRSKKFGGTANVENTTGMESQTTAVEPRFVPESLLLN